MPKPKNKIGLVVASKDEAFWMEVKKAQDVQIKELEMSLKLKKAVRDMAALNEKKEHELFKRK